MAIELIEIYGIDGKVIPGKGFVLPDKKVSIGRADENYFCLKDSKYDLVDSNLNEIRDMILRPVSGVHCEVEPVHCDGNGLYIQVDDISRHGTFVFLNFFSGHPDEVPNRIPSFEGDRYTALCSRSGNAELGSVLSLGPGYFLALRYASEDFEEPSEADTKDDISRKEWRRKNRGLLSFLRGKLGR